MRRIEWDVKDCIQSRQGYILAVKERRDTNCEEVSPGDAETCRVCGVMRRGVLVWQHVSDTCGSSRSYEVRRFGLVAWREVWRGVQ